MPHFPSLLQLWVLYLILSSGIHKSHYFHHSITTNIFPVRCIHISTVPEHQPLLPVQRASTALQRFTLLFGSVRIFGKLKNLWTWQIRTTLLRKLKTVPWGWWMSSKVREWCNRNLNCDVSIYQMRSPITGLTKIER